MNSNIQNEMTYKDYLCLDSILTSQNPLSDHHDEMLFVVIHQVKELWIKLILHELKAAIQYIQEDNFSPAFKMLARISAVQRQMIHSWDVLSTLTPTEYTKFRDVLGQSSGFQSYQYRLFEFLLGCKNKDFLSMYQPDSQDYKELEVALFNPSLYDVSIQNLAKKGFEIHNDVLERDWTKAYAPHETVENAWRIVYQNTEKYWELYQLAEKLTDIEDGLQQWRFRHMKTVERIIGFKTGTGGSSGVFYLKKALERRMFPELWDVRTQL